MLAKSDREKVVYVHKATKRQRTGSIPGRVFISFMYLQISPVVGDYVSKRNIQSKVSQKCCHGFSRYYKSSNTKRVFTDCRLGCIQLNNFYIEVSYLVKKLLLSFRGPNDLFGKQPLKVKWGYHEFLALRCLARDSLLQSTSRLFRLHGIIQKHYAEMRLSTNSSILFRIKLFQNSSRSNLYFK